MTTADFQAALKQLSWTPELLAQKLDVADHLARDWASGAVPVPAAVATWLTAISVLPPALDFTP